MGNPVEPPNGGEYDALASRVSRLEGGLSDIKGMLGELKVMITRIDAQIPHLATKADVERIEGRLSSTDARLGALEGKFSAVHAKVGDLEGQFGDMRVKLAELPSKTYMWGILGVLLTAYGCGLAALVVPE